MYTIVIADDEAELRQALIRRIDWEDVGFRVVGEAENGVEALELVEKLEPDLLLTDVRMPFMSGIDLAREVREIRPTMQIAFLSGFDDFTYAQQAIQYNIISYMLKPISSAELTEELRKIKKKIDEKFEEFTRKTDEQEQQSLTGFLMPLLLDPFQGSPGKEREQALREEAVQRGFLSKNSGGGDKQTRYVVIVASLWDSQGENRTGEDSANAIHRILRKYVRHVSFYTDGRVISLLTATHAGLEKYLHIAVEDISQSVKRIMNLSSSIGVSRIVAEIGRLHEAYIEAMDAIGYSKRNDMGVYFIADIERAGTFDQERVQTAVNEIEGLLRSGTKEELEESLKGLFSQMKGEGAPPVTIQLVTVQLMAAVFRLVYAVADSDAVQSLQDSLPFQGQLFYEDPQEMQERFLSFCLAAWDLVSEHRKKSGSVICDKALEIIENRFMDPELSLNAISGEIAVSPNYLSALIKRSTGNTFIDLLTGKRMETAKKLLLGTSMKIREISEKCGSTTTSIISAIVSKNMRGSPPTHAGGSMRKGRLKRKISLSAVMTWAVTVLVLTVLLSMLLFFIRMYQNSIEKNAMIASEQAVVQVVNTVENYTGDMADAMEMISRHIGRQEEARNEFFQSFLEIRSDVVAVTTYDLEGRLLDCWSDGLKQKAKLRENLSYMETPEKKGLHISKPHVESLFEEYYPWVVTVSGNMRGQRGQELQVSMDIRFSNIADYVDEVGIGQHGYCFIQDTEGNLVYHPQQQLIYSGLKEEAGEPDSLADGSYLRSNVIYTIRTLENCNWRIVGVSYVDELITNRVERMVRICLVLLFLVLITAMLLGTLFSWLFARPANQLTRAMGEFEKNAENFRFVQVEGTGEISALSDSFGHMVVRIQELMEQVRQEEVTLRKTELNALQAQINPHFLYNTLDSIAWMCEEGRNEEAVEMVNALARLFRISISRGHELIPLEKELLHARSYLKIQNYRYKNQFTYHFDVEEGCLPYLCSKITLQPIIENAIYHGIDRMVDEGRIDIRIREEEDVILMTVTDNGVGMSQEQCREILHREAGDRTGIGIKNVNDRIRIYFGEAYGLLITSELDEGTCVEIRIPKVKEGDYGTK